MPGSTGGASVDAKDGGCGRSIDSTSICAVTPEIEKVKGSSTNLADLPSTKLGGPKANPGESSEHGLGESWVARLEDAKRGHFGSAGVVHDKLA